MKVFVVLLAIIGSILAARQEISYNTLPSVLAKQNRLTPFGSRIVGGDDGDIENFPFIVSLQYYGSHFCGGSIIATNKILTAAHCTDGESASSISIMAGITNLMQTDGQRVQVASIHQHPDFNFNNLDADISVLHLVESLILSTSVAVINLPQQSDPVNAGNQVTVLGWGATYEGGALSNHLQYVNVEVISNAECNISYGGGILNGMLCAGVPRGGKDACQGDSGGPLVSLYTELVGIVSWGYGCARPQYPGVYTRVSAYRNWIDNN